MEDNEKRKGIVDRVNDAYGLYQNARLLQQLGRSGAGAVGRAGLAATSGVWGPIAIAGGSILLFFVIIMIISGGQAKGTETQAPPPPQTITQDINGILNITGASEKETETINQALSLAVSYPGYKTLITRAGPVSVVFEKNLVWPEGTQNIVNGLVLERGKIKIRSGLDEKTLRYTFLHETGHIIDSFGSSFPYRKLREEDSACYGIYTGHLLSYPYAKEGGGGDPRNESFAEGVSQFLLYKEQSVLNNFPTQCPNTYNWIYENVFRGNASTR